MIYILFSTILPVERRLKVDPGPKSIHADKHLGEEKAEEDILSYLKELREPLRLVVMLHGNTAGVEEHKQNDKPVEALLLHNAPQDKPEGFQEPPISLKMQ